MRWSVPRGMYQNWEMFLGYVEVGIFLNIFKTNTFPKGWSPPLTLNISKGPLKDVNSIYPSVCYIQTAKALSSIGQTLFYYFSYSSAFVQGTVAAHWPLNRECPRTTWARSEESWLEWSVLSEPLVVARTFRTSIPLLQSIWAGLRKNHECCIPVYMPDSGVSMKL